MGFALRRRWTGTIRGELNSIKRRLNSLKAYNTKHPDRAFLTDAQLVIINSMITNVIDDLLDETVVR